MQRRTSSRRFTRQSQSPRKTNPRPRTKGARTMTKTKKPKHSSSSTNAPTSLSMTTIRFEPKLKKLNTELIPRIANQQQHQPMPHSSSINHPFPPLSRPFIPARPRHTPHHRCGSTHPNYFTNNPLYPALALTIPTFCLSNNTTIVPLPSQLAPTRNGRHHHSPKPIRISNSFQQTIPQRSIARLLGVAGLLSIVVGARYITKGVYAFYSAYKNTNSSFEPVGEDHLLEAHDELVRSAEEVTAMAEQQDQEIAIQAQKKESLQAQRDKEKRMKEAGIYGINDNQRTFVQDDFSDHIDFKGRKLREKAEMEKLKHKLHFESNEAELEMNEIFYRNEFILRGDGAGFIQPAVTLLEAEQILQLPPGACLEEVRERHNTLMRMNHPDLGGSPYLALKVTEAFDILKAGAKSNPSWAKKRQEEKEAGEAARKKYAEDILKEQLKQDGVLDDDGEIKHPDGDGGKRHDVHDDDGGRGDKKN